MGPGTRQRVFLRACAVIALALACSVAHAILPRAVARAFAESGIPTSAVAVFVQEAGSRGPLFFHNATRPMSAASVMKLVTTYVALQTLGKEYRWRTEAYLDGPLEDGVLKGNLILKGYGDPKITIEQWQAFMATLRSRGLARIEGDLVLDRSYFAVPPHDRAAFDGAPLRPYNVGPDALLVNFNSVRVVFAPNADGTATDVTLEPPLPAVHVGSAPPLAEAPCDDWRSSVRAIVDDHRSEADIAFLGTYPATCGERSWYVALLDLPTYVHGMFTTYFRAAGGTFDGAWREGRVPPGAAPFAVLESPPLYDIVRDINKLSNNVMARQVFLTLGTTDAPPPATTATAALAIEHWLRAHRLRIPGLVLENGSGLSRHERISGNGARASAARGRRKPHSRGVRKLPRRRRDRRHGRASLRRAARRGPGAAQDGNARRRARARGLRHRHRRAALDRGRADQSSGGRARATRARLPGPMGLSQRRRIAPGDALIMSLFFLLAEQRIEEAMREGAFDNLPGAGKPLDLEDDRMVPEESRVAYRLLKNAGFIPPELEDRKEIADLHRLLAVVSDDGERTRAHARLAVLEAALEARGRAGALRRERGYRAQLLARLTK